MPVLNKETPRGLEIMRKIICAVGNHNHSHFLLLDQFLRAQPALSLDTHCRDAALDTQAWRTTAADEAFGKDAGFLPVAEAEVHQRGAMKASCRLWLALVLGLAFCVKRIILSGLSEIDAAVNGSWADWRI